MELTMADTPSASFLKLCMCFQQVKKKPSDLPTYVPASKNVVRGQLTPNQ